MLSNYNSTLLDQYIERYGWIKKDVTHPQRLNSKLMFRDKTEAIVCNYTVNESLKMFA